MCGVAWSKCTALYCDYQGTHRLSNCCGYRKRTRCTREGLRQHKFFGRGESWVQHALLGIEVDARAQIHRSSEVNQLDLSSVCDQNIFWLEITMYNTHRMQTAHRFQKLQHQALVPIGHNAEECVDAEHKMHELASGTLGD